MRDFPSGPIRGSLLSEGFVNDCHSTFDLTPFNFHQRETFHCLLLHTPPHLTSSCPQSQGKRIIRMGPRALEGKRFYFIKRKAFLSFPQAVFLAAVHLPTEALAPANSFALHASVCSLNCFSQPFPLASHLMLVAPRVLLSSASGATFFF